MTALAATDITSAAAPRAGSRAARATVAAIANRKVSIGRVDSRFSTSAAVQCSTAGERAGRAAATATGSGRLAAQRVPRALPRADGHGADGARNAHTDAHPDERERGVPGR